VTVLLATYSPATDLVANNFGDNEANGVAGPLALLIIVLLGLATWFLIRNLNARLRRLPREFPAPEDPSATAEQPDADDPPQPPSGSL
jgi:hypothetical protein